MPTIASTLRSTARRVPDTAALVFGERRYTHGELDAQVDRTAAALAGLGLAAGDRFALMATNSDAFVVAFYAAVRLGAVFVPINPASAPPELRYLLEDSRRRWRSRLGMVPGSPVRSQDECAAGARLVPGAGGYPAAAW